MRIIPPYPEYKFFRSPLDHFCAATLCDLSILAYSDIEFIAGVKSPFLPVDWIDVEDTQVMIVRDQQYNIAIAFRGTSTFDLEDWATDLNVRMNQSGIHDGFCDALKPVMDRIALYIPKPNGKKLYLTGHSLGGALANVAAWFFPGSRLVTFGSPRVGDRDVAQTIESSTAHIERYVHGDDIVPTLPPKSLGYKHAGAPRHLKGCSRPWSNILTPRPIFDHVPTLYAERLWL